MRYHQEPVGPTRDIFDLVQYTEDVFQLWLPLVGITILGMCLLTRLVLVIKQALMMLLVMTILKYYTRSFGNYDKKTVSQDKRKLRDC